MFMYVLTRFVMLNGRASSIGFIAQILNIK